MYSPDPCILAWQNRDPDDISQLIWLVFVQDSTGKMALKSEYPDIPIPENVSWPQIVYQHFDKYGAKTAIVSTLWSE